MDGMDMTDDELIFEALGGAFADALPSVYKADTCGPGFHSGIVHGAQLKGDSNAIMLDEVYNKYHSLMVGEVFDFVLFVLRFNVPVNSFNGALLTVYLYMLYPIATFQKAGTCLDVHQSMAKQPIKSCVTNQSRTCGKA